MFGAPKILRSYTSAQHVGAEILKKLLFGSEVLVTVVKKRVG